MSCDLCLKFTAALTKNLKGYKSQTCGVKVKKSILPLLGSILSQVLNNHRNDVNTFQVCNSILMWLSGRKRTVSSMCLCVRTI